MIIAFFCYLFKTINFIFKVAIQDMSCICFKNTSANNYMCNILYNILLLHMCHMCPHVCMFFIYIQACKIIINTVMVATGHCCKSTISPWERSVGKCFQAPRLLLSFLKLPVISGFHIVNLHLF